MTTTTRGENHGHVHASCTVDFEFAVQLRKSEIKPLSDLVTGALEIGRLSLSELGRLLAQERRGAAKNAIK